MCENKARFCLPNREFVKILIVNHRFHVLENERAAMLHCPVVQKLFNYEWSRA